jgi:hypothetical protein
VAAAFLLSRPACAEPVQFTVSDSLSAGQVQEDISVFLGGRLAGSLHIDLDHPHDEVSVSALNAEHYDFALCGRLVRDSGDPPEHRIDDAGTLADVAGRTFAAITVKDTLFTLQDVTEDRPHVAVLARPGPACAPAVASR